MCFCIQVASLPGNVWTFIRNIVESLSYMHSSKKKTCSSIFLNSLLWILPSWCCSRNFENSSLTSSSDIPLEKVKKWTKADEIQTLWHRHGDEGGQCMECFKKIQSHLDLTREKIAPGFKKEKSRTWIWPGMKYRPPSTQACHACTPFCKPGQHLNIQGTFPDTDPQLTIARNFV